MAKLVCALAKIAVERDRRLALKSHPLRIPVQAMNDGHGQVSAGIVRIKHQPGSGRLGGLSHPILADLGRAGMLQWQLLHQNGPGQPCQGLAVAGVERNRLPEEGLLLLDTLQGLRPVRSGNAAHQKVNRIRSHLAGFASRKAATVISRSIELAIRPVIWSWRPNRSAVSPSKRSDQTMGAGLAVEQLSIDPQP